ncbi:unnamed protein product [Bursaphelenchus xylophilus]|uniref:Aldehyde dehydrogenase n=1 Tax=Bursaphelenchus xylophilus TaxID=6326 RepID=A0A1I7SKZ2_BURXY|nr:unnamed protein product [Bursaphelenchus xylophilus]CAG9129307.1 unnamed protein product [Bursaphelenchus xylophilus]
MLELIVQGFITLLRKAFGVVFGSLGVGIALRKTPPISMAPTNVTKAPEYLAPALSPAPKKPVNSRANHFNAIVERQRDFFYSDATLPVEFRKQQLLKLRESIVKFADRIVDAIHDDLKRAKSIAKATEFDLILGDLDYFVENIEKWAATEERQETPFGKAFVYKQPRGVALIIGPFNFPIQLTIRPLIAAIGAGCTAVVKPSEVAENSAQVIEDLLTSTFDPEYVAVVQGDGSDTASLLEQHFDHIFFTGGTQIGKIVMAAAAQHLATVTLEMGGKCPCVIDETADIDEVISKFIMGRYLNNGQVCICPNHVIIHEKVKEEFVTKLVAAVTGLFGKHPKQHPLYARMISKKHWNRVHRLITASKGKVIYKSDDDDDHDDKFIAPYIVEVEADDALLEEELFAPIIPIITVKSKEEAFRFVRESREKPLASYLFSKDKEFVEKFCREIYSGATVVNDVMSQYFNNDIPFGGVGNSGIGRTQGKYGFDAFTHEKSVVQCNSAKGAFTP